MNELAIIPKMEWDDYGALAQAVKDSFRARARAIYELDQAEKPGERARELASQLGKSAKWLFSLRSLYRREGWRAILDKRAAGPSALGGTAWKRQDESQMNLPPAAVRHLKKLFGDNKRASKTAARAFVRQWETWAKGDHSARIPGFEQCPAAGPWGVPVGWSPRNLMRYLPSKFELAAERRGQSYAVGKRGPQIFSTRADLWYMSHVMLDDVWHDNFVLFQRQGICRVLELDALEVFSGALVFWGTKPRLKRADGTFDTALAQYVPLCLAGLLSREGYAARGTEILAEHGTAAVSERVEELLDKASGGLITVRRSGITGEEQAVIGWRGQGKGNPRFKALLESHHSLKHNELAMLPGQTGLSRETRPEFTHGMLEADDDLLRAAQALAKTNPARAAQLRFRLLDYHSAFCPLLMEIYRLINARDWHKLEGWEKIAGNVLTEYRLAPTTEAWLNEDDFRQLPEFSQNALIAAAAEDKRYARARRLAPCDVQRRERPTLVKLPLWAVAELIGPEFGREMKVEGAYFNLISDNEIDTEPLRFESAIVDANGLRQQLPDDTYWCVLNPFDPARVFVHDAGRRFLGVARRENRISRTDAEQLRSAYKGQAKRLAELTAPLIQRHEADIRAETARLKNNSNALRQSQALEEDLYAAGAEALQRVP